MHFPRRGPGRGRADDERAADHAVRPQRASSPAIRRRRAPVDERAVLVAQVDAGPSDLAVWYQGTLGMQFHKLAKKILEARLELATFCV